MPSREFSLRLLEQRGAQTASSEPGRVLRAIIGDPDKVREGIESVARDYGAEEVMVVTITHDHAARRRSYELIAEAFGLRSSATEERASATAGTS